MITDATKNTEWHEVHLDDLVDESAPICYGIVLPGFHHEGGVPVIKVKDIAHGTVKTTGLLQTSPSIDEQYRRSRLRGGDILLTIRGTVGRVAIVPDKLSGANLTQDTARIRILCKDTRDYVYQILQSDLLQNQIREHVVGQAVQGINIRDVRRLKFLFPKNVKTQHFIAEILATYNTAIEKTERLIAAKERQFTAVSHKMLTAKSRISRFAGHWELQRADHVFESTSRKGQTSEPLLSVTQEQGVIPRDMLDGRVTMPSGDTASFKLVEPGDFVISLRSFQGGLEHSAYRGLVSPAYTVLRAKQEIDERFFRHYFKSADFIKRLSVAVIGIRDGKQVSYQDFSSIKLPSPPIAEQRAIAEMLDYAELEIALLREQVATFKRQKRGLMQKLLTGQWRVKANPERVAA